MAHDPSEDSLHERQEVLQLLADILIAAVDGLKGFPEANEAVYPKTQIQLCIVHLVRDSLRYVSWKEWRANWANPTPFFDYAPEIRKVIYATNAIEAPNAQHRIQHVLAQ